MDRLKRFMNGRYGGDQLTTALLAFAILLTIISRLARMPWIIIFVYILLGISLYRMFSKDINRRSMENYKFMMLFSPLYKRFLKFQRRLRDSKTHRYFKCPNCKTTLRVPKGKGKIIITCPRCKTRVTKRT
ncbi:MAG: hypothetical protein ACOX1R_03875 [Caldicoprobacterales bacterium]|jgi:uncharacterized protein YbaR (Trm112 family)